MTRPTPERAFEVRLVRVARLTVAVLDEHGVAVRDAGVWLGSAHLRGPRGYGTVGEDGLARFEHLEPGPLDVAVALTGIPRVGRRWTDGLWVFPDLAPAEDRVLEVRVRRAPTGAIVCRPRSNRGGPATGVELWLAHGAAAGWAPGRTALAGADGIARFEGLQPGTYKLQASRSATAAALATVDVGDTEVALDVEVPERTDLVEVVDPRGSPVEGASILVQAIPTGEPATATTDASGRASVPRIPEGRVYVGVDAAGFLDAIEVVRHAGERSRVVLDPGREVVVRGRVSPDLEGATVIVDVTVDGDAQMPLPPYATDQVVDGAFAVRRRVRSGVPGTARVRIGERVPVVARFRPEEVEVDLGEPTLEDGACLRGRLADPLGWIAGGEPTWIEVRCPGVGPLEAGGADPDGRFVVKGIPAEPVELYCSVSSFGPEGRSVVAATLQLDAETVARGDVGLIDLDHPREE